MTRIIWLWRSKMKNIEVKKEKNEISRKIEVCAINLRKRKRRNGKSGEQTKRIYNKNKNNMGFPMPFLSTFKIESIFILKSSLFSYSSYYFACFSVIVQYIISILFSALNLKHNIKMRKRNLLHCVLWDGECWYVTTHDIKYKNQQVHVHQTPKDILMYEFYFFFSFKKRSNKQTENLILNRNVQQWKSRRNNWEMD